MENGRFLGFSSWGGEISLAGVGFSKVFNGTQPGFWGLGCGVPHIHQTYVIESVIDVFGMILLQGWMVEVEVGEWQVFRFWW